MNDLLGGRRGDERASRAGPLDDVELGIPSGSNEGVSVTLLILKWRIYMF